MRIVCDICATLRRTQIKPRHVSNRLLRPAVRGWPAPCRPTVPCRQRRQTFWPEPRHFGNSLHHGVLIGREIVNTRRRHRSVKSPIQLTKRMSWANVDSQLWRRSLLATLVVQVKQSVEYGVSVCPCPTMTFELNHYVIAVEFFDKSCQTQLNI